MCVYVRVCACACVYVRVRVCVCVCMKFSLSHSSHHLFSKSKIEEVRRLQSDIATAEDLRSDAQKARISLEKLANEREISLLSSQFAVSRMEQEKKELRSQNEWLEEQVKVVRMEGWRER